MNGGYYYKLMNDIDLTGIEWSNPGDFNGVFEGNGYSIKNMSVVATFYDKDLNLGLFKSGSGVVKNLSLEDNLYMVTLETDSNNYGCHFGTLFAKSDNVIIDNVNVNENSAVEIKNNSVGNDSIGGLVGSFDYSYSVITITNSYNAGTISGKDNVGGLVGYSSSSIITITNSYNAGTISGNAHVGGLVGYSSSSVTITNSYNAGTISGNDYVGGLVGSSYSVITITNCYNAGTISGNAHVGGLVGYFTAVITIRNSYNAGTISGNANVGGLVGSSSVITITNSYNAGTISGNVCVGGLVGYSSSSVITITNSYNAGTISGNYAGGLVGYYSSSIITITNSYSLVIYNNMDVLFTVDQLNNKIFYLYNLGWTENIWNLDNLDIENGLYPSLRMNNEENDKVDYPTVTYSFESNGGTEFNDIISKGFIKLPKPEKENKFFMGWYENLNFDGEPYFDTYYSNEDITLYAKWMSYEELDCSEGLEINDGVITGIGNCTETVLYINLPVSDQAFYLDYNITKVIIGPYCTRIGYQAFFGCINMKEVEFLSMIPPEMDDSFGSTWDASDFKIYIPKGSYENYCSSNDQYFIEYVVSQNKLIEKE